MPPTPQQPTPLPAVTGRHLPALDGLRGLAILMVLFWHYFSPAWFPGWIGVDLFFVLSGYLITAKLVATAGHPDYYRAFYLRRVLRVFPLYFAILIAFYMSIHFFMKKENLPTISFYTTHWLNFFTFTQNWSILHFNPALTDRSLEQTWSLAIEEQFYLFWPFVLTLLPKNNNSLYILIASILLVLIARITCYFIAPSADHLFYFNTFLRLDSILAGAAIFQLQLLKLELPHNALLYAMGSLGVLIAAGCIFEKNVSGTNTFFQTVGYTLVALFFACLLYLAVQPSGKSFTRWLQWPFLCYCGKISYGLYLLHYPILFLLDFRIYHLIIAHFPAQPEIALISSATICIALSFLASSLSYRYFESYFLGLKLKINERLTAKHSKQ
jgi:peptidoglycan/LPS O-acetylase OafA/YrhL